MAGACRTVLCKDQKFGIHRHDRGILEREFQVQKARNSKMYNEAPFRPVRHTHTQARILQKHTMTEGYSMNTLE